MVIRNLVKKTPIYKPTLLHFGYDRRIHCGYVLFTLNAKQFLKLVAKAYDEDGAIEGQRTAVRTASAVRIRRRLVSDLAAGAIIPPIVVGCSAPKADIDREDWDERNLADFLVRHAGRLSVIDGMQRTTALHEANTAAAVLGPIRIELWLAPSTENLIYRMLVLNTGQIPWNLRRQLEVVHRGLIEELKLKAPDITIHGVDDKKRRTEAAEFQANDVIEMYLSLKLRKPHVDKEQVLSDQFSKLDLIESVAAPTGLDAFLDALDLLAMLDRAFERAEERAAPSGFASGRAIFDKQSACAGFMAAYAQYVSGKVGMDRSAPHQKQHAARARKSVDSIVGKLEKLKSEDAHSFLALDTLAEVSRKKGGALSIGEEERELFLAAFRLAFEEGSNLNSMEPCWRSQ